MYVFQSGIYPTRTTAHEAVAAEWLSAGGKNDREDVLAILSEHTDAELASECDEGWGMSLPEEGSDYEGAPAPWFELEQLIEAFARLRRDPAAWFGWEVAMTHEVAMKTTTGARTARGFARSRRDSRG
jgi:hypothetical protein